MGEIRRSVQEAATGVSGQGEKSLSPKTQKTDNDHAILKIINSEVKARNTAYPTHLG